MESNQHTPLLGAEPVAHEKSEQHIDSFTYTFPPPTFSQARKIGKRKLPQCIAHRGFKARYPENTLCAFEAAIREGNANAIETDIHLTKDNVVVLSHDADLRRCFHRPERIIECDWDFVSRLRTARAPHVPMPRLKDLLEYISQPSLQHIWILLDIKLDNNDENVMRLIAETLASVDPGPNPWQNRVVLGIWAAKFLPLCTKYLSGYPITYIGFSIFYARQFLRVPNATFNIYSKILYGPIGKRFIRNVQAAKRELYAWTVNDPNLMRWFISKDVDGVITDDPKLFNDVCNGYDPDLDLTDARITVGQCVYALWLYLLMTVFCIPLKHRLAGTADGFLENERRKLKLKATITTHG